MVRADAVALGVGLARTSDLLQRPDIRCLSEVSGEEEGTTCATLASLRGNVGAALAATLGSYRRA